MFQKMFSVFRNSSMHPVMVAVQHLVCFADASLPSVHDYYGKAAAVSIHCPNGTTSVLRGDIHLRLFARDTCSEWDETDYPSRRDVEILRGIMFESPGDEKLMDWLRMDPVGTRQRIRAGPMTKVPPFGQAAQEGAGDTLERSEERDLPGKTHSGYKIGPPSKKNGGKATKATAPIDDDDELPSLVVKANPPANTPIHDQDQAGKEDHDRMAKDTDFFYCLLVNDPSLSAVQSSRDNASSAAATPTRYDDPQTAESGKEEGEDSDGDVEMTGRTDPTQPRYRTPTPYPDQVIGPTHTGCIEEFLKAENIFKNTKKEQIL